MTKRGSSLGNAAAAGTPPQPTSFLQIVSQAVQARPAVLKPAKLPAEDPKDLDGFLQTSEAEGAANSVESMKPLTEYQLHVVSSYSGTVYTNINGILRNKKEDIENEEQGRRHIKAIDEAISAAKPLAQATLLRRGVNSRELSQLLSDGKLLPGATFQDQGFVSTTHAPKIPGSWQGKQFQLTIRAPQGTKGLWIETESQMPSEKEVILPRGAKFRVVSGNKTGKLSQHGKEQWNVTVDLMLD